MAQKDKVKELVGRGLDSYHTKSLQQIDRIEKKNKQQNHKISILSNELDNDYLTKTEEGSVVSLEYSKEGMVYLDELQGNTLVNYCTDGSKELTLNGDIDLEGTFVTTTEGVDNGKVDVICEGNTLINKLYKIKNYGSPAEFKKYGWSTTPNNCTNFEWIDNGIKMYALSSDTKLDRYYRSSPDKYGIFKKNRTYVVRMNVNSNDLQQNATILRCFYGNGTVFMNGQMSEVVNGVFIKKATTSSTIEEVDAIHSMISLDYRTLQGVDGWVSFQNVMVIDVTDLPSYQQDVEYWRNIEYFEGMKSVGQDDENGHKIEILSQNKNLFDGVVSSEYSNPNINFNVSSDGVLSATNKTLDDRPWAYDRSQYRMKLKKGNYTITLETITPSTSQYSQTIIYKKGVTDSLCIFGRSTMDRVGSNSCQISLSEDSDIGIESKFFDGTFRIQIEKGNQSTTFTPYKSNKKEILLNEPLRSLPNGVKDRFVKIGGKLFIERNCGEMYINVPSSGVSIDNIQEGRCRIIMADYPSNILPNQNRNTVNLVCDKIPYVKQYDIDGTNPNYSYGITTRIDNAKGIYMWVTIDKMPNQTLDGFKEFINNTQPKIIYQLETPIYEPLEIEPTLSCYSEVTHFSNNYIIPCNMKIKNSGYNVIIKPSTLYTVALDTNKSGTIGMNLGGAKGTTTNNVLTLTTPATLTDDSLRIYGKGIKGSKVRLLEGDKTNWIPSFFEGMKSCFEDKVQEDGTYKMEILSNKGGMNLCTNSDDIRGGVASGIILEKVDDKGYKNVAKLSGDLSGSWFSVSSTLATKISPNTTITISVLARTDKPNNQSKLSFYLGDGQEGSYINFNEPLSNEYKWVSQTRKFISNSFRPHFGLSYFNGYSVYISKMKIEFGNKMTEWCPSVKDTSWTEYKNYNKIQFSSIEPLRSVDNTKDKFVFKDNKLMIERNCGAFKINSSQGFIRASKYDNGYLYGFEKDFDEIKRTFQSNKIIKCDKLPYYPYSGGNIAMKNINGEWIGTWSNETTRSVIMLRLKTKDNTLNSLNEYLKENPIEIIYIKTEPTYEEIPFELQKIILEGYENGTLFFDTNIPPTSTITYAGETPIVKSVRLNKTEVLNNTNDINDNIIPYLMDMDYRVVCLELATETQGISMARLFGGVYEMLKRDILSNRYSIDEYKHRLDVYLGANKITEDEYNKLGDMLNE